MTIDATFWVAISFFIFFGLLIYLKVPQKVNNSLIGKISEIKKHNQFYFEKNTQKISDKEYDDLKKEILDLEKEYPFLISKDSGDLPTNFTKILYLERFLIELIIRNGNIK